ncbi:hypothetical protein V5F40_05900 [Xanthobacter sp. DSM 14520]
MMNRVNARATQSEREMFMMCSYRFGRSDASALFQRDAVPVPDFWLVE